MGWPPVAMEMAFRQIIAHNSVWIRTIWRFLRTSAIAKTWLLMWKAVKHWCGPDATAKAQKKFFFVNYAVANLFLPANVLTLASNKHFWDAIWSRGSRGLILAKIASFRGFSTNPHCKNHLALWRTGRHILQTWICWTSLSGAFCSGKAWQQLKPIWKPSVHPSPWTGTG
jgi:hypothetical protein